MLDQWVVAIYLVLTLALGLWIARGVQSSEDYQTGKRQYSSWIVFATLSASFMGGGFTIGLAEKTYVYGLVYLLAIFGFSLKEILIATFVAPRMQRFNKAITVGDIMESAFGTRAKVFTGVASVLVCGGIIGAQITACGNILSIFLGLPTALGSILTATVILIYATSGGLKAVVAVDVMHFSVLILILPLVLFFGLNEIGGFDVLLSRLPETHFTYDGSVGPLALLLLFLSLFLGETLIPPYLQRLLIGKNVQATRKGTLWSGIISIPFFTIMGITGMVALAMDPNLSPSLAMPYVIKHAMPVGLQGLGIAALLAVVMSSADAFLNSTAIAMTHDLLAPLGLKAKTDKQVLFFSRLATLLIGVVAIIFALMSSSALDILLYSYQFWTPFILVPLLAALFHIQSSESVFFISAAVGISGLLWWNLCFPEAIIEGALEGVIVGVVLNTITFFIAHKWQKRRKSPSMIQTSI